MERVKPDRRIQGESCITWNRIPKRKYPSWDRADIATVEMHSKTGRDYVPYRCPDCEWIHIGTRPQIFDRGPFREDLIVELGSRVAGCLNHERWKPLQAIGQKAAAVRRRISA